MTSPQLASPVFVGGDWLFEPEGELFESLDPATGESLGQYPVSRWETIDRALDMGFECYRALEDLGPEPIARFLEAFADGIDDEAASVSKIAHRETALPVRPRLQDVELPRTTNQLRQAAEAARSAVWREPIISPSANIASWRAPIPGVVCVFGPNNFPLAFNAVGGGDFAAAIATGHPVLAKANPGHPGVTRLLAEIAEAARITAGLPEGMVQLIYRTSHQDGERLVADSRVGATAYTGSRSGGLALKAAADAAGKPIYLELSSINPVVILPGAIAERVEAVADDLVASMLAGSGQFCTSPGLLIAIDTPHLSRLRDELKRGLEQASSGTLLGATVQQGLDHRRREWLAAGARVVAEGASLGPGCSFPNTMLEVSGTDFLDMPVEFQQEAFGNMSLLVVASDADQAISILRLIEGNLTGSIYLSDGDTDLDDYRRIEPVLRERVGRLLNNKAPTGVAVVAAMNHGGPYPSTGHPGFTAVGVPTSFTRFTMLQCYDGVRDELLPNVLRAGNPLHLQRNVDGFWIDDQLGDPSN